MEEKALLDQVSDSQRSLYVTSTGLKMLLEKKEALIQLCEKFELERLYVFGSVLGHTFSEESDYDFLIKFKDIPFERYTDNYFALHEALESLLNRQIDLLTENSLSNKFFKDQITNSRLLLYAA
ncbi:hypothetical protein SAMN04489724_0648 [Algoriphagus locisalis]|uniref:Polymerase beta nucleotidyltransferase domain-containing protein n=1 Tax=Algoriphagus locisalis TaxID=305507 RepID=A0A1I6XTG4_9BACT|nr:nucleotidyltransferase domain-containing protein [Algoriphagus locisalis]SFT41343.1 hypothetical protein SAMN04489724_0648 [Algoriphagus locisalis]